MNAERMLSAWERAYGQSVVARGMTLLALARPEEPVERLAQWPIGARDGALLGLRGSLFGPQVKSLVACQACGEQVELDFRVEDVRIDAPPPVEFEARCGERQLVMRPPTSADLLALEDLATHEARRRELFRRCVRTSEADERAEWTLAEIQTLTEQLAERDPQADVRLAVECPACGRGWSARFDIVTYLWRELDAWARRLLAEVHMIANAYGWSEQEILQLSPWRRQIYLDMLRR